MLAGTIEKADEDVLDYDVDFAIWLPDGDTIDSAVATISDSTATVTDTDVADDRVKVWISGGTAGDAGTLKVVATTTGGRVKELNFRLRVKET